MGNAAPDGTLPALSSASIAVSWLQDGTVGQMAVLERAACCQHGRTDLRCQDVLKVLVVATSHPVVVS